MSKKQKANDPLKGLVAVVRSVGNGGKTAMVTIAKSAGKKFSITRHLRRQTDGNYSDREGRVYLVDMERGKKVVAKVGNTLLVCELPTKVKKEKTVVAAESEE